MVTFAELESLVKAMKFTAESPRQCLEMLKSFEGRISVEGSDYPRLLTTVRKMQDYCVSEIMPHRGEMMEWLDKNFDRIQKRKVALERDKKNGAMSLF